MITINVDPVLVHVGPVSVRWYGLMYAVGITIGLLVAWPYAKAKGFTNDQLEKILYWAIPAGFVGARLYYVVQQPLGQYVSHPWRIMATWQGGMAFYGAIFAAGVALIIQGWRLKISILGLLDVGAIFAVVGQFFGRIGNMINGDIIGYRTHLPWGVVWANPNSFAPQHDVAYQPAAAYEGLCNILLFIILWKLRHKLRAGMLFFVYVMGYSVTQLIVFFWRDNVVIFLGLKQAQWTAIAVMIAATAIMIVLTRILPADRNVEQPTEKMI